jgi:hypothetical protein
MRKAARVLGVVALTAAAATGCGARHAPPPRAAPVARGFVLGAQLVRSSTGWLLTRHALFLTADGGQTWTPITPPGVRPSSVKDEKAQWRTPALACFVTGSC